MNFLGEGLFLSIENFSLLLLKVEAKKFLIFVKTFLVLPDTKKIQIPQKKVKGLLTLKILFLTKLAK